MPFYRQHERELGFVVVVDRRNDKWSSLRILLTRIAVGFSLCMSVLFYGAWLDLLTFLFCLPQCFPCKQGYRLSVCLCVCVITYRRTFSWNFGGGLGARNTLLIWGIICIGVCEIKLRKIAFQNIITNVCNCNRCLFLDLSREQTWCQHTDSSAVWLWTQPHTTYHCT